MQKFQACEIQLDAKSFVCRFFAVKCFWILFPISDSLSPPPSPTPRKTKNITKETYKLGNLYCC